jgi:hypothetical protein
MEKNSTEEAHHHTGLHLRFLIHCDLGLGGDDGKPKCRFGWYGRQLGDLQTSRLTCWLSAYEL